MQDSTEGIIEGIIEIGGKQYRAQLGRYLYVPKLEQAVDSTIQVPVLWLKTEDTTRIGGPYLGDVKLEAKIVEHVRSDKVVVFKKKRRKGYRVKRGHRQQYTKLLLHSFS